MPSAEFEAAAIKIKEVTVSPSNDNLLLLYALYKQATVGDNNTSQPSHGACAVLQEYHHRHHYQQQHRSNNMNGTFDFKGKAKWGAWTEKKGLSKEDAEKQYIALVASLAP
ncbi:hypothetical protein BGZ97_012819 [Linnemannia gamsii]|uniref:ACB domain-containing protein n=1 Tax=Linnemannia gamsii TaxID=64522 RepID=A0A9P6ULB0_9FUNG|nr:hypothetical protein BGZ97_012819 [Linnemannia gamsii]